MDGIYAVSEISRIIAPILEKYGVSRAYLFGSYARGDALPESDIDCVLTAGRYGVCLGSADFTAI